MKKFGKATKVQTVMFDRKKWTVTTAKSWLKKHGFKVPAVDSTVRFHRFRQADPADFQKGTFRTISFGPVSKGIKTVIAVPKAKRKPKKTVKKPWLPSMVVDLADAILIDLEDGRKIKFPLSAKFSMSSNLSGDQIWILSRKGAKKVSAKDRKAERLYESFTGFEHDDVAKLVTLKPKMMKRIGRAMSIVYRSDKFSKPGNMIKYVHAFRNYPTVSVDNIRNPSIVALRGGRIKIKKEGITG
jgi:hypothetical protein